MDQSTHKVRAARWKEIILQCQNRPQGMSVKRWMEDNQISEKAYYYWQRKIRKEAYELLEHNESLPVVHEKSDVSFAEIPVVHTNDNTLEKNMDIFQASAVIKTPTMTVALSNGISDTLLSRILQEVSHA